MHLHALNCICVAIVELSELEKRIFIGDHDSHEALLM